MKWHYSTAIASCVAFIGLGATSALAQDQIETIVVTAQHVEQQLQRVPIAISAFDEKMLKAQNINTVQDLAVLTPGFTAASFNPAQPNFTIRGIGTAEGVSQNAGGDPSVVVFLDGIYVGRGGIADLDAYDMERVEVLRGPQGTLYGKNAVGGLINFITKKPSEDYRMTLGGTVGNYGRVDVKGRINGTVGENLYASGGVSYKRRDGFEKNDTTGNDVNDLDQLTMQGALRFVPTSDLDIVLSVDYTHQDNKGNPRHNNCNAALPGLHCVGINPDPRHVNAWVDGYVKRDLVNVRGEANWTTSIGTVTSVTGYRHVELHYLTPFFSNPVNPPAQIESTEWDDEDNDQFSQEVRLAFNAFDERLNGVVGGYFLNEDNNRVELIRQDFATPATSGTNTWPQSVSAQSYAVFAQVDYKIFDTLTATLGARQTWEEKSGNFAGAVTSPAVPGALPPPMAVAAYAVSANKSWNAFTPRGGLNWQVSDDAMLYVTAARGFKSGGYQGIAGTGIIASTPYNPEYAWSYEIGAKTQWFDNRLRANISAYKTLYKDLQVSQLVPLCCVVVANAARARIQGVEIELLAIPAEGLQIDAYWAYMDTKYTSLAPGVTITTVGNHLTRAPQNKFHIGAQYTFGIDNLLEGWTATPRVDYTHTSKYFFDPNNIANQTQPAHDMVDARLSFASPENRWEVALWGKNLSDELVATYVTNFAPYGQQLVPYAPPLTFGVSVTFNDL